MTHLKLALACTVLLTGCQTSFEQPATAIAKAGIAASSGEMLGQARLFELDGARTINVSLQGAQAGAYAVSLGSKASCDNGVHRDRAATSLPGLSVSGEGIGTMSALLERAVNIQDLAVNVSRLDDQARAQAVSPTAPASGCGQFVPA